MKYCLVLVFSLIMVSSYAQENDSIVQFYAEINASELFSFENKSIQFKKVISDSRCPKDVTCVWAGEAKVMLAILENGKLIEEKIVTLNAQNKIDLSFLGLEDIYSLKALDLIPYPVSSHKIKDSEYCLKIQLNKKVEK
ncbi:hypothetical protein [Gillisia hiemivivida]|uniref:Uncharacterized protein n=1 Tax=Gillisia hiemivivida TaxID=291190 RepID=A0A5C7A495_9FLAO|nr:hypothetical protein [Gillisia hiemivivida]TXD95659.1 hypothetical protein ES724_01095 [Gillisia hiemivivida]